MERGSAARQVRYSGPPSAATGDAATCGFLQVDKHSETVPLEAALNAAVVAVRHYVLDTLLGVPVLFRAQRPV